MKNFLVSHFPQIATYATIIVIFTHDVLFDREVACTCKDQKLHCNLYISLPIFIIFLLLLWMDKNFNGTCRAYCGMKTRSEANFCCVILIQMGKAFAISLLWVVSVLFDGDWYACCWNKLQGEEALIPCKTSRTLDEQAIVDDLKNTSKIIGLFILLGLLFLVVFFSLLKWSNCCKECSSCSDFCKECPSCSGNCKECPSCSGNCKECKSCSGNCKNCSSCSGNCKNCSSCSGNCNNCSSCSDNWKNCSSCSNNWKNCSSCSDNWKNCQDCSKSQNKCQNCFKFHKNCPGCSDFHKNCPGCSDFHKNCPGCSHRCRKCLSYSDGDAPYELIIIQEEENIVNEILKEKAKEALREKVKDILEKDKSNNYLNCYDAAQQVIDQVWLEANQPSRSEAETHKDAWKLTGNVSFTCSPGEKENEGETSRNKDEGASRAGGKAPPADQPSRSEAETQKDAWKLTGNVSFTCSPGEKDRLMEDQGATGSS